MTTIICALHEDQCTLLAYLAQFFLEGRNFSDKSCRENRKSHFMFKHFFFSKIVPFMR